MTIVGDLIREKIAADVLPGDLALASGLIEDSLAPGAGLEAVTAAIAKARVAFGTSLFLLPPAPPAPASPPAHETVTARVAREAREQRQAPAPSGDFNPWAKGSINITQQVLIQSRDPARAARLQAEAGAR